jgi:hypothetical protein
MESEGGSVTSISLSALVDVLVATVVGFVLEKKAMMGDKTAACKSRRG